MDLRVLGPLEVVGPDGPIAIDGRLERALLAYLVAHLGRAVPADELVDALWGSEAGRGTGASLNVRLSRLRGAIGRERVVREGGGYRLALDPEQVDSVRAERFVAEASGLPPVAALERYEDALRLFRAEPYADFRYADWAQPEIRCLEELRLRAGDGRLQALLDLDRNDEALPALERAVLDQPLRERPVAMLMLARYRSGRQADALAAFRDLTGRLDELGLEPGADLRRLERLILQQAPELLATQPAAAVPTVVLAARPLAERLTSFVGRDGDVTAVAALLREQRLVTLYGPGGVGKTSLAIEVARALLAESPGGVHVVELAELRHPELVPVAIAEALGLPPGDDLAARVRDTLLGQPALLVLDNCEHLGTAPGAAAERLLVACPSLRVLATSREPVRSQGEALYDVEPLPPGDAVRLLADRVRAVRPGLDLDAERDAAEIICARLDGLPLALELAAARVRALGLTEIAARLDDRFGLLSSGTATADERQRTLRGVVEWSYRLLTPEERSMFRRVAVFAGAFDIEAAKAVAGEDAVEALAGLVDRSIVVAEPGPPARYRLLETLRSFGLEELQASGEADDAFARHEQRLVRGARTMARALWTSGAERAARPFQPADRDLALALARVLEGGDAATALPLAAGAGQLAHVFGAVSVALTVLDAALALEGGADADRIEALRVRGALLILQGDYGGARTGLGSAHALAERAGDDALARRVRIHLARASYLDGNPVAAGALVDGLPEALASAGERFGEGLALTVAGTIEFSHGDLRTAIALLGRALAAFEECGDDYGITDVCYFLGFAQADAGETDAAAATYERGLAAAGDALPVYAVWLHYALGKLELAQGDADAGEARADTCAAAARLGGASISGWYPLALRAEAALVRRRFDEAAAWSERARAHLEQTRRRAGATGHLDAMLAQTLQLAARAAAGRGRRREPRILQLAAARHALATKRPYAAAEGLEGVASALAAEDRLADAATVLGAAAAVREAARRPLLPPWRAEVDAVEALLGPEHEDARALGRTLAPRAALAVAAVDVVQPAARSVRGAGES